MRRIGIIGAGHVGGALASRLVKFGHGVQVANSRGKDSLRDFASMTGARPADIKDVSAGVDVLIIAIPLGRVSELPKTLVSSLDRSAVIVDAGNYYPLRDGAIPAIDQGLPEAQWVSQQFGAPVIKAFNNIIASRLATCGKPPGDPRRIALPVAGDDRAARSEIMALVEELGFDAFDAGPIAESWRQQPGQPAYCTDPSLHELPILLRRADRGKAAGNRDSAWKIVARLPPDYPADQLVLASRFTAGLDRLNPRSWLAMLRLGVSLARGAR